MPPEMFATGNFHRKFPGLSLTLIILTLAVAIIHHLPLMVLCTNRNNTCGPNVSIQWNRIRSIYGHDDQICLVVEDPIGSKTKDQKLFIARLRAEASRTSPVHNLDLAKFDLDKRRQSDRLKNLEQIFKKILSERQVRYLVELEPKLFLAIWEESSNEEQYQLFYYRENKSLSGSSFQAYLHGQARWVKQGRFYLPLYHYQSSLSPSHIEPSQHYPKHLKFSFSMFGMDRLVYYPNVKLQTDQVTIQLDTGPKFYFGFDQTLSKIYFSLNKLTLSKSVTNFVPARAILHRSSKSGNTSSTWHSFLYYNHVYLLNGTWVFYFEHLDLLKIQKETNSTNKPGLITIPMAVMHNNTFFRCGPGEPNQNKPLFPGPCKKDNGVLKIVKPRLAKIRTYFWHVVFVILGVTLALIGILLTMKLSKYDHDRKILNRYRDSVSLDRHQIAALMQRAKPNSLRVGRRFSLNKSFRGRPKKASSAFSAISSSTMTCGGGGGGCGGKTTGITTGLLSRSLRDKTNTSNRNSAKRDAVLQPVLSVKERSADSGHYSKTAIYTPSASTIESSRQPMPHLVSPVEISLKSAAGSNIQTTSNHQYNHRPIEQ